MLKDEKLNHGTKKSNANQRKILWSVRIKNFLLSFVRKIVQRYLSVVQLLSSFATPPIFHYFAYLRA